MFEWITRMVEEGGYLGILALMLVENLFPPIPSELIMPLAGFLAARGNLNAVLVMLSGTAGSVLGAAAWYAIGLRFGLARIRGFAARNGRWLGATPDEIDRAHDWFNRHCGKAVLGGRMIPAIRSLISIPAGVARMEPGRFLIFTIIGSAAWSGLLMAAGFVLEDQYSRVAGWVDPVAKLVLAAMVLTYLYRVVTFRKGGGTAV
jgi:membrane protein DedA with SNARE-associated domain